MSAPIQQEAARVSALRAELKLIYGEQIEEEDVLLAIETETEFPALARRVVRAIMADEAMCGAIAVQEELLAGRRKRIEERAKAARLALCDAMEAAGVKKLPLPEATLSLSNGAAKVVVVDETEIPAAYMRQPPPKPDLRAIAEDLRAGRRVAGCVLSNGSASLRINKG